MRKLRHSWPRERQSGQNQEEGGHSALEALSVWVGHSVLGEGRREDHGEVGRDRLPRAHHSG